MYITIGVFFSFADEPYFPCYFCCLTPGSLGQPRPDGENSVLGSCFVRLLLRLFTNREVSRYFVAAIEGRLLDLI